MTVGGLIAGFAVAILAGLVARITELKEDASLGDVLSGLAGARRHHRLDPGHQYRPAARAVRQRAGAGRPDAAGDRLQRHHDAARAGGDLPAAGDRMRRSAVPAHRQPRRRAGASGVPGAGRHQPRQRLSRARHAARRRADDPAGRHRAVLVARHHRHDLHRGRQRDRVGLCRAGAVVPDPECRPGPAIILVAAGLYLVSLLFGKVSGLVRQLFPGRHLEA